MTTKPLLLYAIAIDVPLWDNRDNVYQHRAEVYVDGSVKVATWEIENAVPKSSLSEGLLSFPTWVRDPECSIDITSTDVRFGSSLYSWSGTLAKLPTTQSFTDYIDSTYGRGWRQLAPDFSKRFTALKKILSELPIV